MKLIPLKWSSSVQSEVLYLKWLAFSVGTGKEYKIFIFFIKLHGKPQVSEFFGIFFFTYSDTFSGMRLLLLLS